MIARHNLLIVGAEGREYAVKAFERGDAGIDDAPVFELMRDLRIPPVVKRQERAAEGLVEVGFSSFKYTGNNRLRAASVVPAKSVSGVITPFDVMDRARREGGDLPFWREASELLSLCSAAKVKAGLFGSAALHIITGYPYFNEASDLDVIIEANPESDVEMFARLLGNFSALKSARLDVELDIGGGFAVKLSEVFTAQKTVLAKGITGVRLVDRACVLQNLRGYR